MAIEICSVCVKRVDLDWNSEDIIYCEIKGKLIPICPDCLEESDELCPECGEYRPEKKCDCSVDTGEHDNYGDR